MPSCKSVYDPREDSTMLEKHVREYSFGDVLDMGTGSGIQAITASYNDKVDSIIALDIQEEVVGFCRKHIVNKKISFFASDLFEIFQKNKLLKNKKFDTIIFNPPYLPQELKVRDLTLEGGKKGYEVLEKFLNEVNNFLKSEGIVLIVFSSLTKKEKVGEFIRNNLLDFELLEKQDYFFEELYVYKLKKSDLLKKLECKKISNVHYLTKGKRGLIFTGECKNRKVAIKAENPRSGAIERISNEANFLKKLNKKGIGPKLLIHEKEFLAYEFAEGVLFMDFIGKNSKKAILKMIKDIFDQMHKMDKMSINKEEMSHPQKHIIIGKKPVLLDFEKCHYVKSPGNVTQFCDFIMSKSVSAILEEKEININKEKLISLAKGYRKNPDKKSLESIVRGLK